jgi:hypothetical protein
MAAEAKNLILFIAELDVTMEKGKDSFQIKLFMERVATLKNSDLHTINF